MLQPEPAAGPALRRGRDELQLAGERAELVEVLGDAGVLELADDVVDAEVGQGAQLTS